VRLNVRSRAAKSVGIRVTWFGCASIFRPWPPECANEGASCFPEPLLWNSVALKTP